nr:mitochondrial K+-H+ exchange-related protein [uncultured bacterium]
MKVYLLPLDDEECLFYSEGPEATGEAEMVVPRGGVRGWAEQKYRNLQTVLNESERGVGLRVRRAWEWLQKRTAPDEPLLRSLRGVKTLELVHPSLLNEDEARERWSCYLSGRKRRHTFWLVVNAIFSPVTVLLAPLPGPNVIGYWFVYRAVCHLLARLGVRNAQSDEMTTELIASSVLDGTFNAADNKRVADVEADFGLKGLGAYLERVNSKRGNERAAQLAASQTSIAGESNE